MITKLHSLAAVAAASVLLVAACGSSGPSKTPPSKPKTSATSKTTTPPKSASTGSTSTGSTAATAPTSISAAESAALKSAGTSCHAEYTALGSVLGGSAAGDLQNICNAFSTGSIANVRAAVAKFCTADLSSIPAQYQAALKTGCDSYKKAFGG
jgi:predicted small lipoprotein YifL